MNLQSRLNTQVLSKYLCLFLKVFLIKQIYFSNSNPRILQESCPEIQMVSPYYSLKKSYHSVNGRCFLMNRANSFGRELATRIGQFIGVTLAPRCSLPIRVVCEPTTTKLKLKNKHKLII